MLHPNHEIDEPSMAQAGWSDLTQAAIFLTYHARLHAMRIAASYAPLLYEYLTRQGLDAEALLGPLPRGESGQLPMALWQQLLQRADRLLGIPALGLRIAEGISPRHFGVVGYAALACATLGEALQRLERYHRLVYDVNPAQLQVQGAQLILEWGVACGCPGQLVDETGLAALVQLARNMTAQPLPVLALDFVNPPPADLAPYREFFAGPVRFAQPSTRLVLPLEYLSLPLRQADPALRALLDAEAERFLQQPRGGLVERCQQLLIPLLREGRASLAQLAPQLHRSPRSLQRDLGELGLNFQQLLEDTRRQLAEGYLREPHLPLGGIAALLGFSEQSAFSRAFRQWHGESPLKWRQRLLQASPQTPG
jgi:AraC-like DNA-binding protein